MTKLRKKPKNKRSPSPESEFGYDYGLPPEALVVGPVDFSQLLSQADTFAIAYGIETSSGLGRIPNVTLICRHAEPLKKAFAEFHRWAESADGDSIELSFLFLNKGGYVVGISPEISRLRARILGFDRVHDPLYFAVTWLKILDTRNPPVNDFREYCQQLVSPFTLRAACYRGVTVGPVPDLSLLEQLREIKPILKFSAYFADEDKVEPNTPPAIMLRVFKSKESKGKPRPPIGHPKRDVSPHHIMETRLQALKRHFPVTLQRIPTNSNMKAIIASLGAKGVASWQIDQAVCNLLLSFEVTKGQPHSKNIPSAEFLKRLVSALTNRFEEADGVHGHLNELTAETISTQIVLDSIALLRGAGIKHKSRDLLSLSKELASNAFLSTSGKEV